MEPMYYIGLDVHKRKISHCVKEGSGKVFRGRMAGRHTPGLGPLDENAVPAVERGDGSDYVHGWM